MEHLDLKEKRSHGTVDFPYHIISHTDQIGCYSVPPHWHNEIELIYVEYGNINVYCREEEFELSKDEFFFINSNELHYILGATPSLHHAIIFEPSILDFHIFDKTEEMFIKPITSGHSKIIMNPSKDKDYNHLLKNLILTNQNDYLQIKIFLYTLIHSCYKKELVHSNINLPRQDNIKKVILYIQKNFDSYLTLEDIAAQIQMSPNHLCKYFKKYMGITVFQYINQYKIHQSLQMLSQTDLSIIEIALKCGFDNISYFIKTFKKIMLTTPKQYRKEHMAPME